MEEQEWEDPGQTEALEAAKAEAKRRRELAAAEVAQADEDPEETREWEALKGGPAPQ